jgi:hypothetical protein
MIGWIPMAFFFRYYPSVSLAFLFPLCFCDGNRVYIIAYNSSLRQCTVVSAASTAGALWSIIIPSDPTELSLISHGHNTLAVTMTQSRPFLKDREISIMLFCMIRSKQLILQFYYFSYSTNPNRYYFFSLHFSSSQEASAP